MDLQKLSVYSFSIFILTFPFSVTISQGFAIFSALFFLIDSFQRKVFTKRYSNRFFLVTLSVYLSLLPSIFVNSGNYINFWKSLVREEFSDFWMCFVLLTVHFLARKEEHIELFYKTFLVSAILTLISGLVSIFTPFRLAIFFQNGFAVPEGSRLQHFAGNIFNIPTYLPVGFMNTHLTFGGILGLFFVGLTADFFYKVHKRVFWKNLLYSIVLFLYGFVIFYNGSRSIWIGVIFAFLLLGLRFYGTWKEVFTPQQIKILIPVLILILTFSIYMFKNNWLLQRAFYQSFVENTTENQRYFIYKNTLQIIKNFPIFGVGAGNFSQAHWETSTSMIQTQEELWYELFITPRGHAHHDILHFWAIGGIISLGLFLFFWGYAFSFFYTVEVKGRELLFSGFLILFPAGFFQCYFLDDEVVLPFLAFLGIFSGRAFAVAEEIREKRKIFHLLKERKTQAVITFQEEAISCENTLESFINWFQKILGYGHTDDKKTISKKLAIFTVGFPTILSFIFIGYLTYKDPSLVYKRKIWVSYPDDKKIISKGLSTNQSQISNELALRGFKIEGCLTHRFQTPPQIRTEPYKIKMTIHPESKNPPKEVVVLRFQRDSFDQDQLYKAHKEVYIDEKVFTLNIGENILEFSNLENLKDSEKFPENIYFIDYKFQFVPKNENIPLLDFPKIDFGKLCGLDF